MKTTVSINPDEVINLTNINIEILQKYYTDFRLFLFHKGFTKLSLGAKYIKEAFDDIITADEVVKCIQGKYHLPNNFIYKQEAFNKIYIYIAVALLGINDDLIISEMNHLGFFLSLKGEKQIINGLWYQVLRFEPDYQMQEDKTDYIKSKYDNLYHLTPVYNLKDIFETGLKPKSNNKIYNYPERIYLLCPDIDRHDLIILGQNLAIVNDNPQNNGDYALLNIDITNIPDNIHFYMDPNSEAGVYTNSIIPKENISINRQLYFKLFKKNN